MAVLESVEEFVERLKDPARSPSLTTIISVVESLTAELEELKVKIQSREGTIRTLQEGVQNGKYCPLATCLHRAPGFPNHPDYCNLYKEYLQSEILFGTGYLLRLEQCRKDWP